MIGLVFMPVSYSRKTWGKIRLQDGKSRIPPWTYEDSGQRGLIQGAGDSRIMVCSREVWAGD